MNGPLEEERPRALSPRARGSALVLAVLAVHLLLSWRWSHANGWFARPPFTEATGYRVTSAHLLIALEEGGLTSWIATGYSEPDDHTPLLSMIGALLAWIAGDGVSPTVMWATLMLFASLLGVGTYRLARNFLDSTPSAAVMALTLASPVAQGYQRDYLTTLPMVAMLVWSLDALVRSDSFGRRRWSARFGVLAGLATFAKVIAPLYLIGPALAGVVVGFRRRGADTARNLLMAAALFLAVMGPWLWFNLARVLRYTQAVVEDKGIESVETALSVARWLYYPRQVINLGFGFPLGVLVVAAVCSSLFSRRSRREWSARAWMMAAVVLVSWGILSYGQTSTGSQYTFLWVPLGCLLLVCAITRTTRFQLRVAIGALTALALVWNITLAQRSIVTDRVLFRWHGLHLAGSTAQYMGPRLRRMHVRAEPEAEPWPVLEFTELVLQDSGRAIPRIAESHPFITGNMIYEATRMRRVIDRPHLPWSAVLARVSLWQRGGERRWPTVLPWKNPLWPLTTIDYFVGDTLLVDLQVLLELIESLGIEVDVLATRKVTEHSTVQLWALRKPWRRASAVPLTVLDEAGVVKLEIEFENGWRVHGAEIAPRPGSGASPVVHLFVDPRADETHCRLVLEVENAAGKRVWYGRRTVRGVSTEDSSLTSVCFDVLPIEDEPGLLYRIALEPRRGSGTRYTVRNADRPVEGDSVRIAGTNGTPRGLASPPTKDRREH